MYRAHAHDSPRQTFKGFLINVRDEESLSRKSRQPSGEAQRREEEHVARPKGAKYKRPFGMLKAWHGELKACMTRYIEDVFFRS